MDKKPHIVVFSGAGVSAESGIKTFRDNDGLWENYEISQVATPQAWKKDKELVLRFYNMRRKQLVNASPNEAHTIIAALEENFDVTIITQNIDDLHERAGSSKVIHLHGELRKVQSEKFPELVYDWDKEELQPGDLCERGYQLRPFVVWFGEEVPMMSVAYRVAQSADIFIVVGTSLNVYPAANIVDFISETTKCFLIDPITPEWNLSDKWTILQEKAVAGMRSLQKLLENNKGDL